MFAVTTLLAYLLLSALEILSLVLCLLVITMSVFLLSLLFELVTAWYGLLVELLGAHFLPNMLIKQTRRDISILIWCQYIKSKVRLISNNCLVLFFSVLDLFLCYYSLYWSKSKSKYTGNGINYNPIKSQRNLLTQFFL